MRRIRKMMESGNKEEKDGDLGALGWGLSIRRARWQLGQKPFVRQGTSVLPYEDEDNEGSWGLRGATGEHDLTGKYWELQLPPAACQRAALQHLPEREWLRAALL